MLLFWIGFLVGAALVGSISAGLFVYAGKKIASYVKALVRR